MWMGCQKNSDIKPLSASQSSSALSKDVLDHPSDSYTD
jgi:hypothetical protein